MSFGSSSGRCVLCCMPRGLHFPECIVNLRTHFFIHEPFTFACTISIACLCFDYRLHCNMDSRPRCVFCRPILRGGAADTQGARRLLRGAAMRWGRAVGRLRPAMCPGSQLSPLATVPAPASVPVTVSASSLMTVPVTVSAGASPPVSASGSCFSAPQAAAAGMSDVSAGQSLGGDVGVGGSTASASHAAMSSAAALPQHSHLAPPMSDIAAQQSSVGDIGGGGPSPTSTRADSWQSAGNPQQSQFENWRAGLTIAAERGAGRAPPPGTSGLMHPCLSFQVCA